ncbi:DUF4291 domain-containing protein [Nocardia sp. NPDC005978]|uniref:DUF4291 domain-containing protein n=1 Tax=Nocardia sp. NPDC005978 TaxID=3156725 RepID=UPI0033B2568D
MHIHEIRADYDQKSIVVYQAYSPAIADPAVAAQRFVPPFSTNRMTWIKPSFLWMMERSNWGRKPGQERVLAVRITREGWETALSQAVLTSFERGVYRDRADWEAQIKHATVNVQWDPERTLTGASRDTRSIQVGLSRHIIHRFVDDWVTEITDLTPRVRKISDLRAQGRNDKASALLPKESSYPLPIDLARRLYRIA